VAAPAAAPTSSSSKSASSGVAIPVQHEKSTSRTIPIQKVNGTSSTNSKSTSAVDDDVVGRLDELEKTFRAERAGLEEAHKAKLRSLEDQAARTREQLAAARKESEKMAAESKKALAEVRSRYDKEMETWNKDREQIKKIEKQVGHQAEFKGRLVISFDLYIIGTQRSNCPKRDLMGSGYASRGVAKSGHAGRATMRVRDET
jgi:hypothetical protein